VISLSFRDIADAIGGEIVSGDSNQSTSGQVFTDSREVGPGDIFFAKTGEFDDGHKYLREVYAAGASLAVVQQPDTELPIPQIRVSDTVVALADLASHVLAVVRQNQKLKVIGLTGSNGKTSTKSMLNKALGIFGPVVAPRGSYNNDVGLPLTVLRLELDTEFLVLEMGASGPGSIARLAKLAEPDIGVQLKVGYAHAGKFGGLAETKRIKAEMLPFVRQIAILNADDPNVFDMRNQVDRFLLFGYSKLAHLRIESTSLDVEGTKVEFTIDGVSKSISLRTLGEHHAMNAAATLLIIDFLKLDLDKAIEALQELDFVETGRMQPLRGKSGQLVINDAYNASPESMQAALQTLATLGREGYRTTAVLGAMAELGEFSHEQHDRLGRLVVRYNIDQLLVIGQDAKLIHMGASQEGSWDGESLFFESINQAFEHLRGKLGDKDLVLVKASNSYGLSGLAEDLAEV
jgi:UDP-N-acetylmuramoyl-tripeptide--D-alanyl-D-alanine ligase